MKTALALLFISVLLHAEETAPVPAPGLAGPFDGPRAESAEANPHAEPAAPGWASSPSDPKPHAESAEAKPHAEPAAHRAAKPRAPNSPLRAEVSLIDGSVLKGTFRQHALPARSPNLGDIRIRLGKVESIVFGKPGAPAKIAFKNGDTLVATLAPKHDRFVFDTLLGTIAIPVRAVSSLAFASDETDALIFHCTFDSASSIEHPVAGPAGTFLGGEFVPGKVGNALLVKAGTHAAEVPLPTGLMQPQGCIEFWGKIPGATKESTFPDGGNPQFFAMGVGKWVNTFVKYTSNDGFGTGGLHAGLPGSICVSTLPSWSGSARYPDFLGEPSAWHHYLLDWSDQGLDAASEALGRRVLSALYVDGKLVNPSYGDNGPARAKFLRELVENPVVLAFPIVPDRQAEWQNRVDYMIDDFKIWSAPRTESVLQ